MIRTLINRRTRAAIAPNATALLQNVALTTLTYDDLVQFVQGLVQESEPRLATYTLVAELSSREHEKSERARLESSIKSLAHSTTQVRT